MGMWKRNKEIVKDRQGNSGREKLDKGSSGSENREKRKRKKGVVEEKKGSSGREKM